MKIASVRIVIMIMQVDCVIKVLTQWLAKGVWDSKEEPTVDKWVFVFSSLGRRQNNAILRIADAEEEI